MLEGNHQWVHEEETFRRILIHFCVWIATRMAWGWRCCVLAPARRHVDIDYIPSSFIFTYILSSPMVHTVDEQRNYCSSPQPAGSRTKCGPGVSPAPCLRLYIDLFNILSSILCVFYRLVFFLSFVGFAVALRGSYRASQFSQIQQTRFSCRHSHITTFFYLFYSFIEKVIPFLPSDVIGFLKNHSVWSTKW